MELLLRQTPPGDVYPGQGDEVTMETISDRAILIWALLTAGLVAVLIDLAGDLIDMMIH